MIEQLPPSTAIASDRLFYLAWLRKCGQPTKNMMARQTVLILLGHLDKA
jgi:hypothetical protein